MKVEDMEDDKWYTITINSDGQTISGTGKIFKEYIAWSKNAQKSLDDLMVWGEKQRNNDTLKGH